MFVSYFYLWTMDYGLWVLVFYSIYKICFGIRIGIVYIIAYIVQFKCMIVIFDQ